MLRLAEVAKLMSDKDSKIPDDVQKRISEMMRNANINFVFEQPAQPKEPDADTKDREVPEDAEALKRVLEFSHKPREVRDYLDRFVIQQALAKKVLSVTLCDHYNHVRQCIESPSLREKEYTKPNVILLGPTGVGKTYIMRCAAKLIGVPFVKADATKFSETGYVGYDVEDIVRDLVKTANGNVELAQYGIVYIDEIDKVASQPGFGGRDVSGRGVQINLLKLMEETEVNLQSQTDLVGQMQAMMEMQRGKARKRTVNTRHILFIVSGAFDKLAELVKARVQNTRIGFAQADIAGIRTDADYLKLVHTQDFIKYGFEPEFIGRLPVRVACHPLSAGDLEQVLLKSEGSILRQYRDDFRGYGIEFGIARDAISEVARQADKENTGARGLLTVLERIFRDFKFELPSTSITAFEVTLDTVRSPDKTLADLLRQSRDMQKDVLQKEVLAFADRFQKEHGMKLTFTPEAVGALVEISVDTGKTIRAICEEKFHDFQYGLKLISGNAGATAFEITRAVVDAPDKELSRWIVESYSKSSV